MEGLSVGGHWLKQCLSLGEDDASYRTRFDDRDAVIRVVRADLPGADQQLQAWQDAAAIQHASLISILDTGRADANDDNLIYVVYEAPDDKLDTALADRPLAPAEAREVLDACAGALTHLHERGLAHGAVDPSHVFAIGDRILLAADPVRRDPATTADDMWSLGMLLVEILTRQRPAVASEDDIPFLPEPFGEIARRTLRVDPADRWTAADVESHLHAVDAPPAPAPIVVEQPPIEAAPPPVVEPPPLPPPPELPRPTVLTRTVPLRWIPVVGLIAAAIVSVIAFRHSPGVNTLQPLPPPHITPAAPERTAAERAAPPASADRASSEPASIWRVIVYEYSRRVLAEKKARRLNEQRPTWRAEVFAPRGDRGPYLVSLGGRMSRGDAERVKREARAKGLPRDTFVRNYSN